MACASGEDGTKKDRELNRVEKNLGNCPEFKPTGLIEIGKGLTLRAMDKYY